MNLPAWELEQAAAIGSLEGKKRRGSDERENTLCLSWRKEHPSSRAACGSTSHCVPLLTRIRSEWEGRDRYPKELAQTGGHERARE